MLTEPLPALTDLALGLVTVALALHLRGSSPAQRHWRAAFWWFGVAALAGALHHAVLVRSDEVARVSWTLISMVVVVAVSFVLAATVAEVLGPGHRRQFWALRSVGLVAYAVVALSGHAGIAGIMACEGLTMACVVGLWTWAAWRQHPRGVPVLAAIVASGAAASVKAFDSVLVGPVRLDSTSAYHLLQIAGTLLVFVAVGEARGLRAGGDVTPARAPG